jgi:hypothetical protein
MENVYGENLRLQKELPLYKSEAVASKFSEEKLSDPQISWLKDRKIILHHEGEERIRRPPWPEGQKF